MPATPQQHTGKDGKGKGKSKEQGQHGPALDLAPGTDQMTVPPFEHRITVMCREMFQNVNVVLFTFFDGIGAAIAALQMLGISLLLTLSWEHDDTCVQVLAHHFAPVHMGDVNEFDVQTVVSVVQRNVSYENYHIVITGGPPCADFSSLLKHNQVGSTDPPATSSIRSSTSSKQSSRPSTNISQRLGQSPILVDAADGGIIHPRRLCWSNVGHQTVTQHLESSTPWSLQWSTEDGWDRLFQPHCQRNATVPPLQRAHAPAHHPRGETVPLPDDPGTD